MNAADRTTLRDEWLALAGRCGGDAAAFGSAWEDLLARYAEPMRAYHNLDHVHCVLADVHALSTPTVPPPALEFAAWLHDVIYDPRADDNEFRSAAYARELLDRLAVDRAIREETARLILLTRRHEAALDDWPGQVLLDADLAILGAAPAVYDRYAAAIRAEYAWVSDDRYRAGRAQVLTGFLNRPRIYSCPAMARQAEDAARANLTRELQLLRD
jgi:predicted metal-dependent HD superfamily phosphohydrolase